MSEENAPSPAPSFGQRLGGFLVRLLRAFVRLVAVLAVVALLGYVVFYLLPMLYQQYVQPYQTRIQDLEYTATQQTQTNQQLTRELKELQQRIEALELRGDTFEQVLDEARPGDRIFMVSFGSGAGSDAFSIRVTERIVERRNLAPLTREYVARRVEIDYATYARFRHKLQMK